MIKKRLFKFFKITKLEIGKTLDNFQKELYSLKEVNHDNKRH